MTAMMELTLERWEKAKIAEGIERGLAQGIERGLTEGAAQGRVALLGQLAAQRFGDGVVGQLTALLADESDLSRLDEAGGFSNATPARRCCNASGPLDMGPATAPPADRQRKGSILSSPSPTPRQPPGSAVTSAMNGLPAAHAEAAKGARHSRRLPPATRRNAPGQRTLA